MAQLDAGSRIGELVDINVDGMALQAYVPRDLPFEPPLQLDPRSQRLLQEAYLALGRLDGAAQVLPDLERVYYMYLRKEAVLSSQIEGTQSSLEDFLRFEEAGNPPRGAVGQREILNYTKAVEQGLREIGNAPVTTGQLEALHACLLEGGRGAQAGPGKVRTEQNYISGRGALSFVPPPPEHVRQKLENLLAYINGGEVPGGALVKSAVAHAQFETIHPFMDGNGRLGRILITLLICRAGVLQQPLLFLSLYFKQHRSDYYELLNDLREHGDWESWLAFFLEGIRETANISARSAIAVSELIQADRLRVQGAGGNVLRVYEHLVLLPIASAQWLSDRTGLSAPTVRRALNVLGGLEICSEITWRTRSRWYRYNKYLDLLNAGTEID